ncbi:hypothetical protein IUY40_01305 [Flavobacterium sp. ALJ2]|uniref:hypothetical protein n=1 Tax=Flavobacterium sp. ALJ2 TaxID=2786960 RepID=UPI00189FA110|nr:hypothetical protein [Flavobacterium sp. ALJ2]MBF7090180.1 hypothetical protein [Flavobacterium sp. ALJ2]
METKATTADTLFDKAENYTKTSFELLKLKSVSVSADVLSSLTSQIIVAIVVAFFSLFFNIGLSLFIGKLMGEYYYGFFILALAYLILAIVLFKKQDKWIKGPIGNIIISLLLKKRN